MSRRKWLGGLAGLAVVLGFSVMFSPRALADACSPNGINCGFGYFSKQYLSPPPGQTLYNNLYNGQLGLQANNLTDLTTMVIDRLNCPAFSYTDQNTTASAFIILTMLGAAPGTDKYQACQRKDEWVALVSAYQQQGLIDYNYGKYDSQGVNTKSNNVDVEYYQDEPTGPAIVFYDPGHPGNIIYAIRKECGNPIGHLKSLETPLQPTCGNMSFAPEAPDPNENINITASVNFNTDFYATLWKNSGGQFYIKVDGPNVAFNDPNAPTGPPSSGLITGHDGIGATHGTGAYTVSWGTRGSSIFPNLDCGGNNASNPGGGGTPPGGGGTPPGGGGGSTVIVTYKPYMSIEGGDISVGDAMQAPGAAGDCTTGVDQNAGIVSWNRGATTGYAGAGTNYGALAMGYIQGVATGQGGTYSPNGFAVANTLDDGTPRYTGAGDVYGGAFNAAGCIPNRFGTTGVIKNAAYPLNNGNRLIVNNGQHPQPIYVDGNVVISNNVEFPGKDNYANVGDIPTFELVVRGNIYITPGVTELDGLYVAQPRADGSGGNIYTCAPNGTSVDATILSNNLYAQCGGNPLTFNGSVIAKQLWLLRTSGTETTTPAEKFNFVPESWLGQYPADSVSGGSGSYQAITQLPPIM